MGDDFIGSHVSTIEENNHHQLAKSVHLPVHVSTELMCQGLPPSHSQPSSLGYWQGILCCEQTSCLTNTQKLQFPVHEHSTTIYKIQDTYSVVTVMEFRDDERSELILFLQGNGALHWLPVRFRMDFKI